MKSALRGLILSLFAVTTMSSALAAPVKGNCTTSASTFVSSVATAFSTSSTYATIAETATVFKQGGTKAGCVVVIFTTIGNAQNVSMYLRPTLDNVGSSLPTEVYTHDPDGFSRGTSFTFVFPSVTPGAHTIRMQMHSSNNTDVVTIGSHVTTVMYSP